jgi:hypothetical protein
VCSLPGFFGPKSESNVRGQLARRTTYCGQALRQIRLSRNLDDEEWILIFASVKRTDFVGFMPNYIRHQVLYFNDSSRRYFSHSL